MRFGIVFVVVEGYGLYLGLSEVVLEIHNNYMTFFPLQFYFLSYNQLQQGVHTEAITLSCQLHNWFILT